MYKSELFRKNLRFLRKNKGLNQDEMKAGTGVSGATWSDYERGKTEPDISTLYVIAGYFGVTIDDILQVDIDYKLSNVHLIENKNNPENSEIVHPKVHPIVHPTAKNQGNLVISMVSEPDAEYLANSAVIPITDISVAAGSGVFNSDFIERVDSLRLPGPLIKRGSTYLCVKIKGPSMSPTLQDAGYVIIRHLDRSEWAKMPDERIFVVSDNDGKSYLKRVKNRFKQGFIVLKSDNPDQASFPNFNLTAVEINSIWYVEWYLSAKMPNIHDQYYSRLQKLEDKVDLLLRPGKAM